jgi:hypothetical protein
VRAALALGVICFGATACGGGSSPATRAPTQQDVAGIAGALSDIVYQCQSVAAGFVAAADATSIGRDVDMLLRTYREVRPDAPITIGSLHTTPRRELALAQANLEGGGCAAAQGRRLAVGERQ